MFAGLKHGEFPGGPWLRMPSLVLGTLYHRLRDLFVNGLFMTSFAFLSGNAAFMKRRPPPLVRPLQLQVLRGTAV